MGGLIFTEHNVFPVSDIKFKVGDVISTEDNRVAIANTHEVWRDADPKIPDSKSGYIVVGEATIRIAGDHEFAINTNGFQISGVVCFLAPEYKGCAILKVKITKLHNKSCEAVPLDYLKADKPIDWYCQGRTAEEILKRTEDYPNIKRITVS